MATTKSLNSEGSFFVTTAFGGEKAGRTMSFTANYEGERVSATFTDEQFFQMLCLVPGAFKTFDSGNRPEFDT